MKLAVIDARVHARAELAGGDDRSPVHFDDVSERGALRVDVVGEAGVAPCLNDQRAIHRRRVRGLPDELDAIVQCAFDEP